MWFFIYETKGLSLEQVDELYAKVDKAWQSAGFVPTVSFKEVSEVMGESGYEGRRSTLADIEAVARRRSSVGGGGAGEKALAEGYGKTEAYYKT